MVAMKEVIETLRAREETKNTRVMIGGAPVTPQDYADSIGVDGYAPDATSAVDLVDQFL
jgi:5-methyltetrahydrofolate--homocysteine methyltransferase